MSHYKPVYDANDEMVRLSSVAAELERENAALRKDAERYRRLRDNGRGDLDILWDYQGEELDRLIDSEISREKGANA